MYPKGRRVTTAGTSFILYCQVELVLFFFLPLLDRSRACVGQITWEEKEAWMDGRQHGWAKTPHHDRRRMPCCYSHHGKIDTKRKNGRD
jgi:hypothetical protein